MRQRSSTSGSVLRSNHIEQKPLNRIRVDGQRAIGLMYLGPDCAAVASLPTGANQPGGKHRSISIRLKRVRTEEVGGDLSIIVVLQQRRLRREEYKLDASA